MVFAALGIVSKAQQIAIYLAVIAGLMATAWGALKIHDELLIHRTNAAWVEKLNRERLAQQKAVDNAVAMERAKSVADKAIDAARIASVEKDLADAKANQIAFPGPLTKQLHMDRAK